MVGSTAGMGACPTKELGGWATYSHAHRRRRAVFGSHRLRYGDKLTPEVVAWARGPLAVLHGTSLDDPRVCIHQGDVATAIGGGKPFDAILLDVDNGPDGLFRPANDRLYNAAGLAAARSALTSGGHLAVWSSYSDARFTKRLRQTGMAIEEVTVRARSNGKGDRHTIWIAVRPGGTGNRPL